MITLKSLLLNEEASFNALKILTFKDINNDPEKPFTLSKDKIKWDDPYEYSFMPDYSERDSAWLQFRRRGSNDEWADARETLGLDKYLKMEDRITSLYKAWVSDLKKLKLI